MTGKRKPFYCYLVLATSKITQPVFFLPAHGFCSYLKSIAGMTTLNKSRVAALYPSKRILKFTYIHIYSKGLDPLCIINEVLMETL